MDGLVLLQSLQQMLVDLLALRNLVCILDTKASSSRSSSDPEIQSLPEELSESVRFILSSNSAAIMDCSCWNCDIVWFGMEDWILPMTLTDLWYTRCGNFECGCYVVYGTTSKVDFCLVRLVGY